ncbi:MerR family transcriptional regulator [Deinococcus yavapaiensis]|uniref:MerR family transcriptional regulator n=1 Tax=Deinococcus yavapaiensis KR-236 TaxID=694435 RepID=A0A318S535_9DEIO|nr:MerR family transcriptional regulator [Deinococcus yavapaiensis]PYE53794.1 MerR family transcriptional regulator [Deinococcus yavapaiensis KR-236]
MEKLRIGQVARATGVSVRAIRHYDHLGLLTTARADNRYRVFHPEDVERVRLIQLFLGVGFTLDEVRRWAPCFQHGPGPLDVPAEEIRALYARKIADVDAHIDALKRLRAKLARHVGHLDEHDPHAPISPTF